MNEVLKQRLVGALILVALGVVFWPIIFVEPGERGSADESYIPPRPNVDTSPVTTPDMAGLRSSPSIDKEGEGPLMTLTQNDQAAQEGDSTSEVELSEKGQTATQENVDSVPVTAKPKPKPEPKTPNTSKTRTEAPVTPALDNDGIPIVWILRVASLSDSQNADKLRQALIAQGHKAYVKKVPSNGKTLYRVYVGPKAEKAKLEQVKGTIDSEFKVQSMITRYYP